MHLKVISAGAGSGKTHALTQEMVALLCPGPDGSQAPVRASGLMATTFTTMAAAELEERVRIGLLEKGLTREADELAHAMIGTVHSIGAKLLKRFAFEIGVSPEVEIMAAEDQQRFFNLSLSSVMSPELIDEMDLLSERLGLLKKRPPEDWRKTVKEITEVARTNNFDTDALRRSLAYSLDSFFALLPEPNDTPRENTRSRVDELLRDTIRAIESNVSDTTAATLGALDDLRRTLRLLNEGQTLPWHIWGKMATLGVGAKSRELVTELVEFAKEHDRQPAFRKDISDFITHTFELSVAAIQAYDEFKKKRGLIDYTDMEVLLQRLLDNPSVQAVLREELDLLLVDEFQDTSPIQLQIFLRLSELTQQAIWVGDPKQSIYGFRGAAPELMEAVIKSAAKRESLKKSWRSREELVHSINGLFTKAFCDMPTEMVALEPADKNLAKNEAPGMQTALRYWYFKPDSAGRKPSGDWLELVLAREIKALLASGLPLRTSEVSGTRPIRPCDVAVLCRTNKECQQVANALAAHGIEASVSRSGLLATPEVSLALACLRFLLSPSDSISIAEILRLAEGQPLGDIVGHRLAYLQARSEEKESSHWSVWADERALVGALYNMRRDVREMSPSELLTLTMEKLDLRRLVAAWGKAGQRHANLDELRRLSSQYEDACHRRHDAATWGGLLLWLEELAANEEDFLGEEIGENTVQTLTFHKSKGLEWSVVVCHGLDGKLKNKVFGLSIEQEKKEIDIKNPLAGRLLRYWPYPYADLSKGIALNETVKNLPLYAESNVRALREDSRLLYVALTRARDYLVIPGMEKSSLSMLNRVWHGDEDKPTFHPGDTQCQWLWNGREIPVLSQTIEAPRDYEAALESPDEHSIPYLSARAGSREHMPLMMGMPEQQAVTVRLRNGNTASYGGNAPETDWPMLDAFLAADDPGYPAERRTRIARQVLDLHHEKEWDPEGLVAYSDAFCEFLRERHGQPQRLHRKYPVRISLNGQVLEATVDLVWETAEGSVLVFHSAETVSPSQWAAKALAEAPRIGLAMQRLSNFKPFAAYVHFWQGGGLAELVK